MTLMFYNDLLCGLLKDVTLTTNFSISLPVFTQYTDAEAIHLHFHTHVTKAYLFRFIALFFSEIKVCLPF